MIDFTASDDALPTDAVNARRVLTAALDLINPRVFASRFLATVLPPGHTLEPAITAGIVAVSERMSKQEAGQGLASAMLHQCLYGGFEDVGISGIGALTTAQRESMFHAMIDVAQDAISDHAAPYNDLATLTVAVPA